MTTSTPVKLAQYILSVAKEEFPRQDALATYSSSYDRVIQENTSFGSVSPKMMSPTAHCLHVAIFQEAAGQVIPDEMGIPDLATRQLRARLTLEEALETIEALGIKATLNGVEITNQGKDIILEDNPDVTPDVASIVKECLDCQVIATGTMLSLGVFETEDLQLEVDVNNLVKFRKDKDGHKREDGKWVKPSDHPAARIQLLLDINRKFQESCVEE